MRARGRPGICAYCRQQTHALEDEHVFPESWYPLDTPSDVARITVPSCTPCNRNYGRLEERLQRQWGACIETSHPAARGVWERASKSLEPERGRNERDTRIRAGNREKLKRSILSVHVETRGVFPGFRPREPSLVPDSSGGGMLMADAMRIDRKDVETFTAKLVRGLHYSVLGHPLPEDVKIRTYVVREEVWPELIDKLSRMTPHGIPPGFVAWRAVAKGDPTFAIWYFLVWGQIFLQAATVPDVVYGRTAVNR